MNHWTIWRRRNIGNTIIWPGSQKMPGTKTGLFTLVAGKKFPSSHDLLPIDLHSGDCNIYFWLWVQTELLIALLVLNLAGSEQIICEQRSSKMKSYQAQLRKWSGAKQLGFPSPDRTKTGFCLAVMNPPDRHRSWSCVYCPFETQKKTALWPQGQGVAKRKCSGWMEEAEWW